MARPKIMNKMRRTIVQLDEKDFKKLIKVLKQENVSIAQFFRNAVAVKFNENRDGTTQN
jgi:hypothetical protein